jgi:hypothetical protein
MPTDHDSHARDSPTRTIRLALSLTVLVWTPTFAAPTADAPEQLPPQTLPRQHAEQAFQNLSQHENLQSRQGFSLPASQAVAAQSLSPYPPEDFLRGVGEGDLSKGRLACQRVSELAARTDLAKQIRVRVTEHAVDRLRERMGQTAEQDIEVIREEMVNELLRDVRIVDKRIDEATGTCISIAVMPRSRVTPDGLSDSRDSPATPVSPTR